MDKVTIFNSDLKGNKDIVGLSKAPAGSNLAISNTLMYFPKEVASADTIVKGAINFSSAATLSLTNSVILSNLFTTKINPLIRPEAASASWTTFENNTTVTEVSMNDVFGITMVPARLTSVGDPRGHAGFTGLSEISLPLQAYPNPTTDVLCFDRSYASVEVINTMGQRVVSAVQVNRISVSSLQVGYYLVRATDESGKQFVQKISKQ